MLLSRYHARRKEVSAEALATLRLCAGSLHFPIDAQVCSVVPTAREVLGVCTQDLDKKTLQTLATQIGAATFQISGKSTFKEEFVTAGGILLKEVHFKTFESRILPGLYFAGEVLDIDAITGGFNFQAAWTGGWIAGKALSEK